MFFLGAQARPVDVVTDVTADEGADAGAAGAVAAGAGEVDLGYLKGLEDSLGCICGELDVFRLNNDGERSWRHGFANGCRLRE